MTVQGLQSSLHVLVRSYFCFQSYSIAPETAQQTPRVSALCEVIRCLETSDWTFGLLKGLYCSPSGEFKWISIHRNSLQGVETCQWTSMVTIAKAKGKNIISSYLHIMVFICPFLPLFSPLTRHNGQVFLGLPGLTIVQNPHAHCANHEKIMLWGMLGTGHRVPVFLPVWKLWVAQIPHRHLTGHNGL